MEAGDVSWLWTKAFPQFFSGDLIIHIIKKIYWHLLLCIQNVFVCTLEDQFSQSLSILYFLLAGNEHVHRGIFIVVLSIYVTFETDEPDGCKLRNVIASVVKCSITLKVDF